MGSGTAQQREKEVVQKKSGKVIRERLSQKGWIVEGSKARREGHCQKGWEVV